MIIKCRVCQEPLQHTPDRPHSTCTNVACSNHRVPVVTVPYEQFCLHPDKCRGRGSCPRNYACSE